MNVLIFESLLSILWRVHLEMELIILWIIEKYLYLLIQKWIIDHFMFFEIVFNISPKLVRMCLISNCNSTLGEDTTHGLVVITSTLVLFFVCFAFLRLETREDQEVKSFKCRRGFNIIKATLHKDPQPILRLGDKPS